MGGSIECNTAVVCYQNPVGPLKSMQTELSEIERVVVQLAGKIQNSIEILNEKNALQHSSIDFNAPLSQNVKKAAQRAQNIKSQLNLSKFNAEELRCIVERLIPAFEKTPNSFPKVETTSKLVSNDIAANSGFCSFPVGNVAQPVRVLRQKFESICKQVEPTIELMEKVTNLLAIKPSPEQTTPSKTPISNS